MSRDDPAYQYPVACQRCGVELQLGRGSCYFVTIEAMADPSPPQLDIDDFPADLNKAFRDVLEELSHISAQEAMDQVYRRMSFYLCARCYARWIENPTG